MLANVATTILDKCSTLHGAHAYCCLGRLYACLILARALRGKFDPCSSAAVASRIFCRHILDSWSAASAADAAAATVLAPAQRLLVLT